jgi:hypothetical protein
MAQSRVVLVASTESGSVVGFLKDIPHKTVVRVLLDVESVVFVLRRPERTGRSQRPLPVKSRRRLARRRRTRKQISIAFVHRVDRLRVRAVLRMARPEAAGR